MSWLYNFWEGFRIIWKSGVNVMWMLVVVWYYRWFWEIVSRCYRYGGEEVFFVLFFGSIIFRFYILDRCS